MPDPFDKEHWRPGEAYKTPKPAPVSPPICTACGSRHDAPTPWCKHNGSLVDEAQA